MFVKCRFLDDNREPKGREYTYSASDDLDAGEIVTTQEGKKVVITEINVSPELTKGFEDKIKGVLRIIEQPEEAASPKQELIIIKQLPIIEERLKSHLEEVEKKVNLAVSLACTEETVKTVKEVRADLNKDFKVLEEQRLIVKRAIMSPYELFENGACVIQHATTQSIPKNTPKQKRRLFLKPYLPALAIAIMLFGPGVNAERNM